MLQHRHVVTLLSGEQVRALRAARLTYEEVEGTRIGSQPGYGWLSKSREVDAPFDAAAAALLSWQMQERAGLRVACSSPRVEVDAVVTLRLGFGPMAVSAPCRVVYVIDEPDRRGFAYGTLPGHPESGEESFVLERRVDDRPLFTVRAFSRSASALARLGGPATRMVQARITDRYLRALDT